MSDFDAKAARAKRPLPLWVDALVRDTALLETDEFGAYIKILMAMWTSRSVALPNEPRKLARAAGVSLRLWNSRVGPALTAFWTACPEGVTQKRLREEAAYTERQVTLQSCRKTGQNPDKYLKTNKPVKTTDKTTEAPADHPTQLPNIRGGCGSSAREAEPVNASRSESATAREQILEAMGYDGSGVTATGKIIGRMSDMQEYQRWQADLGLDHGTILTIIAEIIAEKRRSADPAPPVTFSYFTKAMQRAAGAMAPRPALTPIEGGRTDVGSPNQPARTSRDPHARALGGMVESFGRVIAAQRSGGGDDP